MFSQYSDQVSQLKATDSHFSRMFDEHNVLDEKIRRLESHEEHATHEQIEQLKKEKLLLKDQCYAILRKVLPA